MRNLKNHPETQKKSQIFLSKFVVWISFQNFVLNLVFDFFVQIVVIFLEENFLFRFCVILLLLAFLGIVCCLIWKWPPPPTPLWSFSEYLGARASVRRDRQPNSGLTCTREDAVKGFPSSTKVNHACQAINMTPVWVNNSSIYTTIPPITPQP